MKKVISTLLVLMMMMVFGISSAFAATSYDSVSQFSKTKADGSSVPWKYMYSVDQGATFKVLEKFNDWGNGGGAWNPDIDKCYAGIGSNPDQSGKVEFNASDNNAQIGALAFVAPKDGNYKIKAFKVTNPWEQTPEKFYIFNGSTKVFSGDVPGKDSELSVPEQALTLKAGDTVYFYGKTKSAFTSVYAAIVVEEAAAQTVTPSESTSDSGNDNPKTGDSASIIVLAVLAVLSGIVVFSRRAKLQ